MTKDVTQLIKAATNNKEIGVVYTVDGEVSVRMIDGKRVRDKYTFAPLGKLHRKFNQDHAGLMEIIFAAVVDIRKMRRTVPLTRNELIRPASKKGITKNGVSKVLIKDLVKFGLIEERIISIVNAANNPVRAQAVVYFTPRGRTYVRERIDDSYKP